MNATTRRSLKEMRSYWERTDSVFRKEQIEACTRLLGSKMPLDDEALGNYFDALNGPEGCDFRKNEKGETTWTCAGGTDKSKSEAILKGMGYTESEITLFHEYVDVFGGHCDCEICFNATSSLIDD